MKIVAIPTTYEEKQKELKQWDLWGPFIICLILGIVLTFTSKKATGIVFSTIFIIMWIGSMIITINSTLLGGKLSLLQCICLLGYCTFPAAVSAILTRILLKFLPSIGKIVIVIISFLWSTKASIPFIAQNIEERKKLLVVYPVMLYFLYLNYFILV
jgi:hypothetical protein